MLSPWEKRMRVHANNREVSVHPGWKRQLKPRSALGDLGPDRTTAVIMKQRRGFGALVGAGPASGHFPLPIVTPRKMPAPSPPT